MEILAPVVSIVLFLVIVSVLALVHEAGHFVVARLAGIRVHEFGIGFPPRAAVIRRGGETLYTFNWLPLGGFVRLEGEEGESEDPRSFVRASLPKKLIVLVAGVAMNFLLAIAIFASLAWFPGPAYGLSFETVQPDSPAASVGLAAGDQIVSLDGRRFDQFEGPDFLAAMRAEAGRTVVLGVVKGAVDATGRPTGASETTSISVTLRTPAELDATHGVLGIGKLGFSPSPAALSRSPFEALGIGTERARSAVGILLGGLAELGSSIATDPTQAPPAAGPVGMVKMIGDVWWGAGLAATLYLAGLLSATMAITNILPIPPFDGGRVLLVLLKALSRGRLSVRTERLAILAGLVFLLGLYVYLTVFDIARLGGGVQ